MVHDSGRGGEQRTQNGAPFGESRRLTEADIVIFQRVPPHQQQEVVGMFDALAHLHLPAALRAFDMGTGLGESLLEGFGLAGLHGDQGAFEDQSSLRILAAMGSSVAASTMTLPCGAMGTPSWRGTMWKWTWKTLWPAASRLYCLSRMPSGFRALSTAFATFCVVAIIAAIPSADRSRIFSACSLGMTSTWP